MTKNLLLSLCVLLPALLKAQFQNDPNALLDPVKYNIEFPNGGFRWITMGNDEIYLQSPDGSDWTDSLKITMKFNMKDDMKEFGFGMWDGTSWSDLQNIKIFYSYNSKGKIDAMSRQMVASGTNYHQYFAYTFNSSDNVTLSDNTDSIDPGSGWLTKPLKDEYSYDGSGRITEKISYEGNFGSTDLTYYKKWTLAYDAAGMVSKVEEYSYDENTTTWELGDTYEYKYDGSKRMTNYTQSYFDGMSTTLDEAITYTYNTDGSLAKITKVYGDVSENDSESEYFYLSDGRIDYVIESEKVKPSGSFAIKNKSILTYDSNKKPVYALRYAYNGSSYSKVANQRTVYGSVPTGSAPAAPSGLTVSSSNKKANAKLYLKWTDNSDNEDGFIIHRSTDGTSYTAVDSTDADAVSYTDSGLTANTKYFYKVTAYNSFGASGFSNEVSETTLIGTGIAAVTNHSISIYPMPVKEVVTIDGITENATLTLYNLQGKMCFVKNLSAGNNTFTLDTLPKGIYHYRISTSSAVLSIGKLIAE